MRQMSPKLRRYQSWNMTAHAMAAETAISTNVDPAMRAIRAIVLTDWLLAAETWTASDKTAEEVRALLPVFQALSTGVSLTGSFPETTRSTERAEGRWALGRTNPTLVESVRRATGKRCFIVVAVLLKRTPQESDRDGRIYATNAPKIATIAGRAISFRKSQEHVGIRLALGQISTLNL